MKNVTVFGATGLVGRSVVELLSKRSDVVTIAVVRRKNALPTLTGVTEKVFNFVAPDSYEEIATDKWPCDVLICCIGSTMRAAGSRDAFLSIERDIPLAALNVLKKRSKKIPFIFISSVGADAPKGFYLQTKAHVENEIKCSGLPYALLRPSLMLGSRTEFRPGEMASKLIVEPMFAVIRALGLAKVPLISKYSPIAGERVAKTAVHLAIDSLLPSGSGKIIEGNDFLA